MATKKRKSKKTSAEKSRKARVAAEKKRIAEFARRSRAAKKGWANRRKNSAKVTARRNQKKIKNAAKALPKKKRAKVINSLPKLNLEGKTIEELHQIIRMQQQQVDTIIATKNFVNAMPPEYLHDDGTIALEPSRARLNPAKQALLDRMHRAAKISENALDREIVRLSDITGYTLKELYTLFHSP